MISKEEYARLYCEDHLVQRGIYALSTDKVMAQMMRDPMKTLKDLDDYGLGDAMAQSGIQDMQVMDVRTGEKRSLMHQQEEAAIHQALEKRENINQTTKTPILDKLLSEHEEL